MMLCPKEQDIQVKLQNLRLRTVVGLVWHTIQLPTMLMDGLQVEKAMIDIENSSNITIIMTNACG